MNHRTNLSAPVEIVVDTEKLLEQIGWREAYQLSDGDYAEEGGSLDLKKDLASQVAFILAQRIESEMKALVRQVIEDLAKAKVQAVIDDVIAGDLQKTNRYGEPTGEKTTLRAMIVDQVKAELTRKVNSRGESATYGDNTTPYVEYFARKAARDAIAKELRATVDEAIAGVKSVVRDTVSAELAERIMKAVR